MLLQTHPVFQQVFCPFVYTKPYCSIESTPRTTTGEDSDVEIVTEGVAKTSTLLLAFFFLTFLILMHVCIRFSWAKE